MRITKRDEKKYSLDLTNYYSVRNYIMTSQMELDYYSRDDSYLVRSLYFDTDDFQSYQENLNGLWGRIKLRIRSYSSKPSDSLSVEIKTKYGGRSVKYRTFISYSQYQQFMEDRHFSSDNPVLVEFERLVHLRMLKPKVIVEYKRDGFVSKVSSDLRITFDHQICSTSASDLFPKYAAYRKHIGSEMILEIKTSNSSPYWVNRCVKQYGLKWIANSKFMQGIEFARPDVISRSVIHRGLPLVGKQRYYVEHKEGQTLNQM